MKTIIHQTTEQVPEAGDILQGVGTYMALDPEQVRTALRQYDERRNEQAMARTPNSPALLLVLDGTHRGQVTVFGGLGLRVLSYRPDYQISAVEIQ